LSERLNSVTSQFDKLRSERFQDAINRAMPRRKFQRKTEAKPVELSRNELPEIADAETSTRATVRVQEQLLDDETHALQVPIFYYFYIILTKWN
jgi:syntaxin 18